MTWLALFMSHALAIGVGWVGAWLGCRWLFLRWNSRAVDATNEHVEQALELAAPDPLGLVPVGSAVIHRQCRDARTDGRITFMCGTCAALTKPRRRVP